MVSPISLIKKKKKLKVLLTGEIEIGNAIKIFKYCVLKFTFSDSVIRVVWKYISNCPFE